ncbi:MAG: prepilin-type N-terminal cleavage/methylation domain-containing protein [Patescibacteria group bacterium]|nr:prepilin-type N-terminal cleavage/methylation domain-containing protein [Patescibacteria group bacterium]
MQTYFKKPARAFTLVELMVVIAIIGILASIIVVSLSSSKAKGRDAKRVSDIRTIQLALEEYYNDNQSYPVSIVTSPFTPNYLTTVPKDPSTNSNYFYTAYSSNSGSGNCSVYKPTRYHLGAATECDAAGNNMSCPTFSTNDSDWVNSAYTVCSSGTGADFNGTALNCIGMSGQLQPADNCYDVTN